MDTYMYEADSKPNQRYALKQQRLDIVRSVLRNAIEATTQADRHTSPTGTGG